MQTEKKSYYVTLMHPVSRNTISIRIWAFNSNHVVRITKKMFPDYSVVKDIKEDADSF
jgi:hypothetical protein